MSETFKRGLFALLLVLGIIGVAAFPSLRQKAFPSLDVELTADRSQVLAQAAAHAEKYGWGPENYRQAAWFSGTANTNAFIELKEGREVLAELIASGDHRPYRWCVRHFEESNEHEATICFSPDGAFWSIRETIPETEPGAAIDADAAEVIARDAAAEWGVDLDGYGLESQSEREQPSGRVDHTIVYRKDGVELHGAFFEIHIRVAGDRASRLLPYVNLPETWSGEYGRMRDANESIALVGLTWGTVGGLVIPLLLLATLGRRHGIRWRRPFLAAAALATFTILPALNSFPLLGRQYDTALPWLVTIATFFGGVFAAWMGSVLQYALIFTGVDVLLRRAFPEHVDIWKVLDPRVASSGAVTWMYVCGLAAIGPLLLYVLSFYMAATGWFGWWYPAGFSASPDVMATAIPALTPLGTAMRAGISEEWLYRALPIGLAALAGRRFGRRWMWISVAVVASAFVFGAAHATYPQMPAYARMIELAIAWTVLGFVFARWGLLPVMVLHVYFDLFLMASPLFDADAPGVGPQRAIVVLAFAIPYLVLLGLRVRNGPLQPLALEDTFGGWKRVESTGETAPVVPRPTEVPKGVMVVAAVVAFAGLVGLFAPERLAVDGPQIELRRGEAIAIARQEALDSGVDLDGWDVTSTVRCTGLHVTKRYVWEEVGQGAFRDLLSRTGGALCQPEWRVRFVRFGHESVERHSVNLSRDRDGDLRPSVWHTISEDDPGATLTEDEARALAYETVWARRGIKEADLDERVSRSTERKERLDWYFEFVDTRVDLGEADVRISGKILGDAAESGTWVRLPDAWERQKRRDEATQQIVTMGRILVGLAAFAGSIVLGFVVVVRGRFRWRILAVFFVVLALMIASQTAMDWPETVNGFNRSKSWGSQAFRTLATQGALAATLGLILGFPAAAMASVRPPSLSSPPAWLTGLLMGAAMLTLGSLDEVWVLFTDARPIQWGPYAAADSLVPELAIVGTAIAAYVVFLCKLIVLLGGADYLSGGWSRRQVPVFVGLVVILVCAGNGAVTGPEWASALGEALLTAIFAATLLRAQFAAVAWIPVVLAGSTLFHYAVQQPHPGSLIGAVIGFAALLGAGHLVDKWLVEMPPE